MKITGAEAITRSLIDLGVDLIFGYPGGAIMPTYDALYDVKDKLHHVLVRHEQGAAFAACGYARVTKKPGVCLATSGPGATNLITGMADAMLDSIPLICITGQVNSALIGTDAFQESDIISMTVPITKWSFQITRSEQIPEIIHKAFHIASSGRPGPVLVDITKDAQIGMLVYKFSQIPPDTSSRFKNSTCNQEALKQAAHSINEAKKPYILVGHGIILSEAEEEIINFAEKAQIPVASTLLGLSIFPSDHSLYVGMLGMHGNYAPNKLTNEADLIIAVGMRFDDRVTGNLSGYAPCAKIIHIELDAAEINKNVKADIAIHADAKVALTQLIALIKPNKHTAWLEKFKQLDLLEHDQVIRHEVLPQKGQLKMAEVIYALSKKTQGKALIVTDVGQHQMITARYYQFAHKNSHLTSGGLGAMGFALPAAIGAKFAAPDREVIVITGDGSFQMNIQELAVIAQEKLPIKIIILNNNYLGMVRQWQELFFENRFSYTELHNPDFVKIAEAYAIKATKVDDRKYLSQELDVMLHSKEAYLLDVSVEKQENVFPMLPVGASVDQIRLR